MTNDGNFLCPWCGAMMGPWMFFWGVIWLALLALLILGVIWLVAKWTQQEPLFRRKGSSNRALEILKERYARGEMNKEEFEERKRDLAA